MTLNDKQFGGFNIKNPTPLPMGFHGTKAGITGEIKPASATGAEAAGISETNRTYFTPNEEEAWGYATGTGRGQGRPRVYQTRPIGHQELDVNHVTSRPAVPIGKDLQTPSAYTEMTAPRTVDRQQITDTLWTPTPRFKGGWVQGTLPHVNWHQFDAPNWVQYTAKGEAYDDFGQVMESPNDKTNWNSSKSLSTSNFKNTPLPGFESTTPKPTPTPNSMPL